MKSALEHCPIVLITDVHRPFLAKQRILKYQIQLEEKSLTRNSKELLQKSHEKPKERKIKQNALELLQVLF